MIQHPEHKANEADWKKYRLTYKGGKAFVEEYLEQRPNETNIKFQKRLKMTHCPAHSKSNLNEIKNSIFTRMHQGVTRNGGSLEYQAAVKGEAGGVDRKHASMTGFIGSSLLPKLLSVGKVGVWVDAPTTGGKPFFNIYQAEDILSWVDDPDNPGHFLKIYLRRHEMILEDKLGFPSEQKETFRAVLKTDDGIKVIDFDEKDNIIGSFDLNIPSIPFVIAELTESLLTDVADYQITLLNLDSTDVQYCWLSNTPLYTEQIDANQAIKSMMGQIENPDASEGSIDPIITDHIKKPYKASGTKRTLGNDEGIGYPIGAERPQFISPPSDPLQISMKKQEVLRDDIRTLINLSLTTVLPRAASAESKQLDERGLEAGLSAIGLELQALENRLAELWAVYEESKPAKINYPDEYELKSDADRLLMATEILKVKDRVPSRELKKKLLKQASEILLAGTIQQDELEIIFKEIDEANGATGEAEAIFKDVEAGILSVASAAKLRGYDEKEAEVAQKEKAKRIAITMNAQRGDENFADPKVRGDGNANSDT